MLELENIRGSERSQCGVTRSGLTRVGLEADGEANAPRAEEFDVATRLGGEVRVDERAGAEDEVEAGAAQGAVPLRGARLDRVVHGTERGVDGTGVVRELVEPRGAQVRLHDAAVQAELEAQLAAERAGGLVGHGEVEVTRTGLGESIGVPTVRHEAGEGRERNGAVRDVAAEA